MSLINFRTHEPKIKKGQMNNGQSPFDKLAHEYDAWFDKDGKLIFADEVRAFETLLPYLPKPWLEIGVGSGRFAKALGIETGIDSSIKLVKLARKRGVNAFLGRGEQKLFKEASFGTVFLIVTLCFLDSPLDVLKEANRILRTDGKVVLGLVLKESPWGHFYQIKKAQGHRFYGHAKFYTFQEVVKLLNKAGFVIKKIASTLFQRPGEFKHIEEPKLGYYSDAGFTIIVAGTKLSTSQVVGGYG